MIYLRKKHSEAMLNGIIDSTGMLELITHLEETFSIKVADAEMIPANFDSIDSIGAFVANKLSA